MDFNRVATTILGLGLYLALGWIKPALADTGLDSPLPQGIECEMINGDLWLFKEKGDAVNITRADNIIAGKFASNDPMFTSAGGNVVVDVSMSTRDLLIACDAAAHSDQ